MTTRRNTRKDEVERRKIEKRQERDEVRVLGGFFSSPFTLVFAAVKISTWHGQGAGKEKTGCRDGNYEPSYAGHRAIGRIAEGKFSRFNSLQ